MDKTVRQNKPRGGGGRGALFPFFVVACVYILVQQPNRETICLVAETWDTAVYIGKALFFLLPIPTLFFGGVLGCKLRYPPLVGCCMTRTEASYDMYLCMYIVMLNWESRASLYTAAEGVSTLRKRTWYLLSPPYTWHISGGDLFHLSPSPAKTFPDSTRSRGSMAYTCTSRALHDNLSTPPLPPRPP